jgi:hypothetical protein
MNFKERFLTAVNHEEPDQVPVMGLIMDPATVNQIMGKEPADFIGMMQNPELRNDIKSLLNTDSFYDKFYYGNTAGALESAVKLGFDANWTIYSLMQLNEDPKASQGLVWHDVFGRVWDIGRAADGSMAINYSRALCETEEQWEDWVESKKSLFEKAIDNATVFHKRLVDEYGDRILPVGYAAPGIFENSWQPIGFVNFTRFVFQRPEFIRRVIDFHTDFYLRYLEGVMKSGIEVVLGGGPEDRTDDAPGTDRKAVWRELQACIGVRASTEWQVDLAFLWKHLSAVRQVHRVGFRWHNNAGANRGYGSGEGAGTDRA